MTKTTETHEERVEKGLVDLYKAADRYNDLPTEDKSLGVIFEIRDILNGLANAPAKHAENVENSGIDADDRYAFYLDNFERAKQGIVQEMLRAAAEILRVQPYFDSRVMGDETAFTRAATSIVQIALRAGNQGRVDLLINYASDVDSMRAVNAATDAEATRDHETVVERLIRLEQAARNLNDHRSSKKAWEGLIRILEGKA